MAAAAPNLAQAGDRQTKIRWYATGFAAVALIVALRLLLHLLTANRYGIFRDELYYIACSRHLDWGYVDMPPFIPAVTRSEEHTSELQSLRHLVCRLLLEKKK